MRHSEQEADIAKVLKSLRRMRKKNEKEEKGKFANLCFPNFRKPGNFWKIGRRVGLLSTERRQK
jgi:hypothetical protein